MTIWAIVPAAGVGSRMASGNNQNFPKQYRPLLGRAVLSHTLEKLLQVSEIHSITVAVGEADDYWSELPEAASERVVTVAGGAERMDSVLNALHSLDAATDDWVLVHDAVRPCVRLADIQRLLTELANHPVGGLLVSSVDNTVKRFAQDNAVLETVDRDVLCNALTPQMFRYSVLLDALRTAQRKGLQVTDESSAIEQAGLRPQAVFADKYNIKITHEGDLALAEMLLRQDEAQ